MFIRMREVKTDFGAKQDELTEACAKKLSISADKIQNIIIYRRSLDARRSRPIMYTYIYSRCVFEIKRKAKAATKCRVDRAR